MDELWVECQDDPGAAPRRFGWGGAAREVREVLDRWDGEGHRYFRLRDETGAVLILRQDLEAGSWRLHFFEREAPD